ncbi:MAG: NAD(P)/FAD-dependent oxidoreductase [Promethearchaeota archaeon]
MTNEIKEYDVVIVGAGPGGLSTAYSLSEIISPERIAVVERNMKDYVGKKACGDAFLREWCSDGFLRPTGDEILTRWDKPIVIVGADDTNGESTLSKGDVINRFKYQQRLIASLEVKGVTFYYGRSAKEPIIHNNSVIGLRMRNLKTRDREIILSKVVVDCTGANHVIRRRLPPEFCKIKPLIPKSEMTESYREILNIKHDLGQKFYWKYISDFPIGSYFWYLNHGKDQVNAGIYLRKGSNVAVKDAYDRILHKYFVKPGMKYQVLDGRGALIPSTIPLFNVVANGFVVISDSAGLVNSTSGEGLGSAVWCGKEIAGVIARALRLNDVSEQQLWEINLKLLPLMKKLLKSFLGKNMLETIGIPGLKVLIEKVSPILGAFFTNEKLSLSEQIKAIIKLRKTGMLSHLLKMKLRERKIEKIFKKYPQKSDQFEEWEKRINVFTLKGLERCEEEAKVPPIQIDITV